MNRARADTGWSVSIPIFSSTRKWYWASRRSCPARMGHSLYASLIQTFLAIRISVTVKMHMFHGVIRIGDDRKMDTIVTLLSALLFPGRFTEIAILFNSRLLKSVR